MKPMWWKVGGPVLLWLLITVIPVPGGLTPAAWHYFALFAAVILALILEPIPAAAIGMIGIAIGGVMRYVDPDPARSINWALAGIEPYDAQMRDYYRSRSGGTKDSSWSEELKVLATKSRPHMREFLARRGFTMK